MAYLVQKDTEHVPTEIRSKLALLVQHNPLAIIEFTADLDIIAWNPAAAKLFGYDATEVIGQKLNLLFPASDIDFINRLKAVFHQGKVETISHSYRQFPNHAVLCQWHCVPLTNTQKRVNGMLATIQPCNSLTATVDQHCHIKTTLNQAEEAISRTAETDTVKLQQIISKLQKIVRQRNRILHEHNQSKQVLQQSKQVLEEQFQQTNEALKNTQKFLSAILNSLPIPVFVKDANDLKYLLCNPAAEKLLGVPAKTILGKTDYDLFPIDLADRFTHADWTVLNSGKVLDISEQTVALPDQESQFWHVKKVPITNTQGQVKYLLLLREDITERKQAEAQLREQSQALEKALKELQQTQAQLVHTEKMLALGKLAAGMAHEINNPINFIHGNLNHAHTYIQDLLSLVQLYQQYFPTQPVAIQDRIEQIDLDFLKTDLPKLLNSMRSGTDRVREMVLALRNFSRLDEANLKSVDLHEGLDNTLLMLQERLQTASSARLIEIIKDYSPLPFVECYPSQINQVFLHLLTNALDALEEEDQNAEGPSIATESKWIRIRTETLNSEWVAIHIADNGPGIPENLHSKVFDPFFTTKPVGQGKGLGLSISYQIVVAQHNGRLILSSIPGRQTEFSIHIPVNH